MNKDYTDISIVLDRSGSMASIKLDTEKGFNHFIDSQKNDPGITLVTLAQFDTMYEQVYLARPIKEVPVLDLEPRGSTALLDAIARTITATGQRLAALPEDQRPGFVVFVIVTDGEENASQTATMDQVNSMITEQTTRWNWKFVFLGANQDAIATAVKMGIGAGAAMTYAANTRGTHAAYQGLSSNLNVNKVRAAKGQSVSMDFSAEQRDEQSKAGA